MKAKGLALGSKEPASDPGPLGTRWILATLGAGLLYVLVAQLPFRFELPFQAYLFHPAEAVGLAALMILGPRAWWGVLLGSLILNLPYLGRPSAWVLVGLQVAGPLASALLVRRLGIGPFLSRPRDLLRWAAIVGAVNALSSSLPGPALLAWGGGMVFASPWLTRVTWFLGDFAALLCLTPFFLVVVQPGLRRWLGWTPLPEALAPPRARSPLGEGILVALLALLVLGGTFGGDWLRPEWRLPLRFAAYLPALWAALRLGLIGAAGAAALVPSCALALLWLGTGGRTSPEDFHFTQIFLLLLGLLTLTVGAAVEEARHLGLRYRDLVEGSPDGLAVLSADGRIQAVNAAFCALAGRGPEAFHGRFFGALFEAQDPGTPVPCPGDTDPLRSERILICPDGPGIPVEVHGSVLTDGSTQVRLRDLREYRAAETRRLELEAHLHQAQKLEAVGTLAGGIAHDFNNLLTIMLVNLERLEQEFPLEGKARGAYESVVGASQRAAEITRQLMSFARHAPPAHQPVEPGPALEEALVLLRSSFDPRIRLRPECHPASPRAVIGSTPFQQILVNLCVNARDAMPEGGELAIRLFPHAVQEGSPRAPGSPGPGRYLALEVEDTGTGMDRETLARAFEPFFTTKEVGKGTGLGLSIVFSLVRQHRGWVGLRSDAGRGTCVSVYLPAHEEELPQVAPPIPIPVFESRARSVLVVEDEALIRDLLRSYLESCGFRVSTAADGQEGLDLFRSRPDDFDVVVLDLVLPRLHGYHVLEGILALRPELPILICSGYAMEPPPSELICKARIAFRQKPFRSPQLLEDLRLLLNPSAPCP